MVMESIYSKLIKALEAKDYKNVVEILTTTPLGNYLLEELGKRGFDRKEVLSAVAGGQLSALVTIENITFEMAILVNNYVMLVNEGKYVEAIKLVVGKPEIINTINMLQGTSHTIDDFLTSLTYHAIKSGAKPDEVKSAVARYEGAFKRGLVAYLTEIILDKINKNELAGALDLLSKNLDILVEINRDNTKNIALLLFNRAVVLDNEQASIASLNLLKKIGVVGSKETEELRETAEQLSSILSEEAANVIMDEVNRAVESGDPNKIVQVAERYKSIFEITPFIVEGVDAGVSIYEYLTKLALYLRAVEPILFSIYNSLNNANECLKTGNLREALSNATKAMEFINEASKQRDLMALLLRLNAIKNKQPISLEEAGKRVEEILKSYRDNADLIAILAKLGEGYDKALMDRLYRYAKTDINVAEIYATLSFQYEASTSDIEAILANTTTTLLAKIRDLGVDPLALLRNNVKLMRSLVTKAAAEYLEKNKFSEAKNIAEKAIKLGLNSELTGLRKAISGIEQTMYYTQVINETVNRLSKIEQPSSLILSSQLSVIRNCRSILEEISNMPELEKFMTKEGVPFKSVLKSSINYVKDIEIMIEVSMKGTLFSEQFNNYATMLSEGKISGEDFYHRAMSLVSMLDEARKILDKISTSDLKEKAEDSKKQITASITDSSTVATAVLYTSRINKNVNELLTTLKDGLQFPEEGEKAVRLWFNTTITLKAIKELLGFNISGQTKKIIESMYDEYMKYLTQLKTDLIKTDMRLEDLLNIAESRSGVSIPYEKPYFPVPVVGELEKYVKIGIQQVADWIGRLPNIGSHVASFWKGFANVLTAILQPWGFYQSVQNLIAGASDFFGKVLKGDFKGAWETLTVPVSRFFSEDPFYAAGSILGAIFMAMIGTLAVKKFRLPPTTKELVINVLQGDPFGLAISYIAVPVVKGVIKLIRGLVTTEGAVFDISGIEKIKDVINEKVETRVGVSATSLKRMYDFLKKHVKTVGKTIETLRNVINEKGIDFARATRDMLYEAIDRAMKSTADIINLLEAVSKRVSPENVIKLSRVLGISDVNALNKAIKDLGGVFVKIKNAFNIDLSLEDILRMDIGKIGKISEAFKKVVTEMKDVTDKVYSVLIDSLEEIRKIVTPEYTPNINIIKGALADYAGGDRSAIFKALNELEIIVKNVDPDAASSILKKMASEFKSKGLADIAKTVEKMLNDVEAPKSNILNAIKSSIIEKAKDSLQKIERIPELSNTVKTLLSGIDAGNLSLIIDGLDKLSGSLPELVKTIKNIDVLTALSTAAKQLTDSLEDIKENIIKLGLDKFDFYKKMLNKMDKIASGLYKVVDATTEAAVALKAGLDVSEIAKSLGFDDIAKKLLKEQISVSDAIHEIRKKLVAQTIDKITPSLITLTKMVNEMFKEPALFTVRMMLMNLVEEVKGEISNLRVSESIVKALNEIASKYGGKLTPEVLSELRRAINEPTLGNVSKVIDMIGYNPVLASAIDLSIFVKMIDDLTGQMKEFAVATKSDAAMGVIGKLSEVKKYVLGSDVIIERYAVAGLIDPSFIGRFVEALYDLKKVYPLLSDKIDLWMKKVVEFVNKVNEGDVKGALAVKGLEDALSEMSKIGMPPYIIAKIKDLFTTIKEKLEKALKKTPRETEHLKALKEFSDKIVKDVNLYGTIEPGNFGYIISDVEEVVGKGIKTAVDFVPEVRRFLEKKWASLKFTVDGYEINATRTASLLPTEVSVKYTFLLPSGGEMYADVVARPIKIAGETINAVYTYIYYDPKLLTDPAARAIVEMAEKGVDIVSKIDPEGANILPKIFISTDFGSIPMSTIVGKAVGSLISSLAVALNISRIDQLPETKAVAYKIYLQENLKPAFESLRDMAIPIPENIAKELAEKGVRANMYIPAGTSGIQANIAIGDITNIDKITLEKIKILDIKDLGKIILLPIQTTQGEILVMPTPTIIETKISVDQIIEELKKTIVDVKVEPVPVQAPTPAPIQIQPVPVEMPPPPVPVPPPPKPPTRREYPQPPTTPKPAVAGLQVMTIGAGRPTLEKLQY